MVNVRLSEDERVRMLEIVDRMLREPPTRAVADVDAELSLIRASRRRWGRRQVDRRRP